MLDVPLLLNAFSTILINAMSLFSAIQLFGWQKQLENNWNSDAEILRELGKRDWAFLLYFAGSFSLIFNNEICPSESAQTFVKNLFQVSRYSI